MATMSLTPPRERGQTTTIRLPEDASEAFCIPELGLWLKPGETVTMTATPGLRWQVTSVARAPTPVTTEFQGHEL